MTALISVMTALIGVMTQGGHGEQLEPAAAAGADDRRPSPGRSGPDCADRHPEGARIVS